MSVKRLVIGVGLVVFGVGALGVVGWQMLRPTAPPFRYVQTASGPGPQFADLPLADRADLAIRKFEVRADGIDRPLAEAFIADRPGQAPRLLEWRNALGEPLVHMTGPAAGARALAEAIGKHAKGATVLAWWDTAQQLALFCDCTLPFDRGLGLPVFLPETWRGHARVVAAAEAEFWGRPKPGRAATMDTAFEQFTQALLGDDLGKAAATLREFAGTGDAYLVVSLADAYKLAALYPGRLGIAFKDFPADDTHGTAKTAKAWMSEQGHAAHAGTAATGGLSRVYYLTDQAATTTVMAQLLPFNTSNPFVLTEFELVHQQGEFWVYRIPSGAAPQS